MAGPDSGCDSSCFTFETPQRSLRSKNAITIDIFSDILLVVYSVVVPVELYELLCRTFRTCVGRELSSCFTYGTLTCESVTLSTSSMLFLLSFNKCISSNNCKSIRYLWRRPVRKESHTRLTRAQCSCKFS